MRGRIWFASALAFGAAQIPPTWARAQDIDACIGASERALTQHKEGKLLEARGSLSTCAGASCPAPVRASCQDRLAELTRSIPSIVFFTKEPSGADVAGVKLTVDGTPFADRVDGSAIVLDPGEHEFRFDAVGRQPLVKRLVMHQGEQNRREDVVLQAVATAEPSEPKGTAGQGGRGAPAPAISPPAPPDRSSVGAGERAAGLVVGGVGLAALAAGAVFGALSLQAHSDYEGQCGASMRQPTNYCTTLGIAGEADAANKGNWATAFFVGGGVGLAVGVGLFVLAPRGRAGAALRLGPSGVLWSESF